MRLGNGNKLLVRSCAVTLLLLLIALAAVYRGGISLSLVSNLGSQTAVFLQRTSGGPAPADHSWRGPSISDNDQTLSIDDSVAKALKKKSRLFCWANSLEDRIATSLKAINDTWIRRCDDHMFFIESKNKLPPDAVSLGVKDGREYLTDKSTLAWKYLYKHKLQLFDWFLQGDEDAYVIVENLRFLLSHYDPKQPVYLGFIYKHEIKEGFMSGGASYILSREAVRRLVEDAFNKNVSQCPQHGGHIDDVNLGKCMAYLGIRPGLTLDRYGRHTFHTHNLHQVITGTKAEENGILSGGWFPQITGRNCCSELTVSFHYVVPKEIYILDQLLYRISVYGRVPVLSKFEGFIPVGTVQPIQ